MEFDKHKIWLIVGILIAVVIVGFMFLYPLVETNFAGQATFSIEPETGYVPIPLNSVADSYVLEIQPDDDYIVSGENFNLNVYLKSVGNPLQINDVSLIFSCDSEFFSCGQGMDLITLTSKGYTGENFSLVANNFYSDYGWQMRALASPSVELTTTSRLIGKIPVTALRSGQMVIDPEITVITVGISDIILVNSDPEATYLIDIIGETCGDSIDNDLDGQIDCFDADCLGDISCRCQDENDSECVANLYCIDTNCQILDCSLGSKCPNEESCVDGACTRLQEEICDDSKDNDLDFDVDCSDEDCFGKVPCNCVSDNTCEINQYCNIPKFSEYGACTDLNCEIGEIISNHECIDLNNDNNNCGVLGNVCLSGQTCMEGSCVGEQFATCVTDNDCLQPLSCLSGKCNCPGGYFSDGLCCSQEMYETTWALDYDQDNYMADPYTYLEEKCLQPEGYTNELEILGTDCNDDKPFINICAEGEICQDSTCVLASVDSDGDGVDDFIEPENCKNTIFGYAVLSEGEYAGCMKGDVNADGIINSIDILAFFNYYNHRDEYIYSELFDLDYGGPDNKISSSDILGFFYYYNTRP